MGLTLVLTANDGETMCCVECCRSLASAAFEFRCSRKEKGRHGSFAYANRSCDAVCVYEYRRVTFSRRKLQCPPLVVRCFCPSAAVPVKIYSGEFQDRGDSSLFSPSANPQGSDGETESVVSRRHTR